jgi:hypothetical protein
VKILELSDIIIKWDVYEDILQNGVTLFWGTVQAVCHFNQSEVG